MNSASFSSALPGFSTHSSTPTVTDVYTNLNGMTQLKSEKNQDEALKKVAQQFESMFINMMLKNMRSANAVFEKDSMFNSSETQFYRDMYDNQLALSMASKNGIGIADALYRQMQRQYNSQTSPEPEKHSTSKPAGVSLEVTKPAKSLNNIENTAQQGHANKILPSQEAPVFTSPEDFVKTLTPLVNKAAKALGVEPEFLVAQAALETGWGKKITADASGSSFNLFNIKADQRWQGQAITTQTQEFRFGQFINEQSSFRKYSSLQESVDDYVAFLQSNPRYKNALLNTENGEVFLQKLQHSGYATDPDYASKVVAVYSRVVASADENSGSQL